MHVFILYIELSAIRYFSYINIRSDFNIYYKSVLYFRKVKEEVDKNFNQTKSINKQSL